MASRPRRGPPLPRTKKSKINNRSLFWKALETSGLIFPGLLLIIFFSKNLEPPEGPPPDPKKAHTHTRRGRTTPFPSGEKHASTRGTPSYILSTFPFPLKIFGNFQWPLHFSPWDS